MHSQRRAPSIVAIVALAIFLTPHFAIASGARSSQNQQEPQSQEAIIKEVRHQLVMLPYYSVFDNLTFSVTGDNVTLNGQVVRPTLKSDAEAAAKSVKGVASVTNNIEVLPVSPMDNQLRRAEYRAIYADPQLFQYAQAAVPSIHIIVKNGHVTLEGVADNDTDKGVAGLRANSVPNVFSVTNNLMVTGDSKKTK